jgi:MoxR-like ATPase
MFNIWLNYPSHAEEIRIVKMTTSGNTVQPEVVLTASEILFYQNLIRKIPVPDNVYNYAVDLVSKTRPGNAGSHQWADNYLTWGAGPRASQNLIIGAKCHAVIRGKYSPDIEDVRAVAIPVLRHRIVRNYKADAEGIREEKIINHLL